MFCFVFGFRLVMWEWKVRRNNFESQEKTDKTLTYITDYIKKKLDLTSASAITRKSESVGHERVVHSISCVSMNEFTNKREILKKWHINSYRSKDVRRCTSICTEQSRSATAGRPGFLPCHIINIQREI